MAKFFYRMQNILDIKYKMEDQAKQEFSEAQNRYLQETDKLEHMKQRKESHIDRMRSLATKRLDVLELEHCNESISIFDGMIAEQKEAVFRAMTAMDRARQKLDQVVQERKTHEKLKENQFEEFLKELNEEEMKEIDELVSYQHHSTEEGE